VIDVGSSLRAVMEVGRDWSADRALEIARSIATDAGGDVDWDDEAGEEWVRVVRANRPIAVLLCARPLAFAVEEVADALRRACVDLEVIVVPAMDEPILTSDHDVLAALFGDRVLDSEAFAAESFSVEELWFATV
jgi:hypothetical protein